MTFCDSPGNITVHPPIGQSSLVTMFWGECEETTPLKEQKEWILTPKYIIKNIF